MPHVSNPHGQVNRRHQMNRGDIDKMIPEGKPRNELGTAYGGDQNKGSDKSRRLNEKSDRTPIR